jgi:hypothetical protein
LSLIDATHHWGAIYRANQQPCQNGLTGWGYLPGQWRLASGAYPLFLRQPRVNDGGVGWSLRKAVWPNLSGPHSGP